jgi:hypothetical protein
MRGAYFSKAAGGIAMGRTVLDLSGGSGQGEQYTGTSSEVLVLGRGLKRQRPAATIYRYRATPRD